ncbi:MAG: hypothetical protein P8Y95_18395, partial [Gammaproteobacteria bacterium]
MKNPPHGILLRPAPEQREPMCTRTSIRMLLVAALFAVLAGCTWVKLTPEGEQVRVLALTEASQCERIGRIRSHTKESVA